MRLALAVAVAAACARAPAAPPCSAPLAELGPGFTVERWPLAADATTCIDAVRVDLAQLRLRALTRADASDPLPAPAWRARFELAAVTNANMFHADGTPVGLIVQDGVSVGTDNAKMSGFLAFDPRDPADPAAVIAGRDCAGFDLADLRRRYASIVQSYRLLGCDGAALAWREPTRFSVAALALDRLGRVVLLHARAPSTMSELAATLARDHDLTGALFLEGGPEASLVVRGEPGELSLLGDHRANLDTNHVFWALPNVLGLARR